MVCSGNGLGGIGAGLVCRYGLIGEFKVDWRIEGLFISLDRDKKGLLGSNDGLFGLFQFGLWDVFHGDLIEIEVPWFLMGWDLSIFYENDDYKV